MQLKFENHVPILISQFKQLKYSATDDFFQLNDKLIKYIHLVSVIISVEQSMNIITYKVDNKDSVISIIEYVDKSLFFSSHRDTLELGTLVSIKGKIQFKHNEFKVIANEIRSIDDVNFEYFFYLETIQLHKRLKRVPIPDEIIQKVLDRDKKLFFDAVYTVDEYNALLKQFDESPTHDMFYNILLYYFNLNSTATFSLLEDIFTKQTSLLHNVSVSYFNLG